MRPGQKVKAQLVADVLNSQHAATSTTWLANKYEDIVNWQGKRHIVVAARPACLACVL